MTLAPPPAIRFLAIRDRALVVIDLAPAVAAGASAAGPARSRPGRGAGSRAAARAAATGQPRDLRGQHPLFDALLDGGLPPIGSTADGHLVRTVGLAWTLDDDALCLDVAGPPSRTTESTRSEQLQSLLRIRAAQVDRAWLAVADHGSPILLAGIAIGLQRDDSDRIVLHRIEQTIRRGDLIGGRVDLHGFEHAGVDRPAPAGSSAAGVMAPIGAAAHAGASSSADAAAALELGGATVGGVASDPRTPRRRRFPKSAAGRLAGLGVASLVVVAMVGQAIEGDDDATTEPPPRPLAAAVTQAAVDPDGVAIEAPAPFPATAASWVVAGPDGTPVRAEVDGDVIETAAAGLTWPIIDEVDGGYFVATHCGKDMWVDQDDVVRPEVRRGDGLRGAVIALDAGHGGIDSGAVGPNGLNEADLNLAIAERLQDMLERSNDIDLDTGSVTPGTQVPPVAAVVMTRDEQDANQGHQRTSLTFRGDLATGAEADATLSIHHNSGGTGTFTEPTTEVYYSIDDEASPRLAGLVLEELRRSLAPLDTVWGGSTLDGTIGRTGSDGEDYYAVLKHAEGPAVITEASYLSGPRGAELAATDEFQQAEAEAMYRALVRFLDTEADVGDTGDSGPVVSDPANYDIGGAAAMDFSSCSLAERDD